MDMHYAKISGFINAHVAIYIFLFFSIDEFRWLLAGLIVIDGAVSYYFFRKRACKIKFTPESEEDS